jgi:hypothetical protein
MSLLGLQSYDQQIVTGIAIFLAASADGLLHWLKPRLQIAGPKATAPGLASQDRITTV